MRQSAFWSTGRFPSAAPVNWWGSVDRIGSIDPEGRSLQLVERLHSLAHQHPRYGYRRVWKALCQDIQPLNPKRIHRLWKLEGLSLHRRKRRKRRSLSGSVPCRAESVNHVWTYDFVHDSCANGQKLKMLTVLDEYSRYCLAIEVAGSISSASVIRTLESIFPNMERLTTCAVTTGRNLSPTLSKPG